MEKCSELLFDTNEIQICESLDEMKNKMDCFFKRKREEINEINDEVYCSHIYNDNYAGSSRTHSITVKRQKGSECFIKNTKVQNSTGPLLKYGKDPAVKKIVDFSGSSCCAGQKSNLYERISNLEKCLNINKNEHNIYEKLKLIEDHVLLLEDVLAKQSNKLSLSKIFQNIQKMDIIAGNLNTNDIKTREEFGSKCCLLKKSNIPVTSKETSKISKYTANEIQDIINDIKRNDSNQIH